MDVNLVSLYKDLYNTGSVGGSVGAVSAVSGISGLAGPEGLSELTGAIQGSSDIESGGLDFSSVLNSILSSNSTSNGSTVSESDAAEWTQSIVQYRRRYGSGR